MSTYTKDQVSASRRVYGNPYAHIELLEEETFVESLNVETAKSNYIEANSEEVQASRKLLQNQYSHLDEDGNYKGLLKVNDKQKEAKSAVSSLQNDTPQVSNVPAHSAFKVNELKKYSDKEIEEITRGFQKRLWKEKNYLWNGNPPKDPIEVLSPSHALHLNGYSLEYVEGFGSILKGENVAEVAGYIDSHKKKVCISEQFEPVQQLFTAAHELGHTLLHGQALGRLHRDRPSDGANFSRDRIEREADKFAVYFLMPEKLVKSHFSKRFRTEKFAVTEETAVNLGFQNTDKLKEKLQNKRNLAYMLASTTNYQGSNFKSIASQFRVSIGAMAIRLEELDLISF